MTQHFLQITDHPKEFLADVLSHAVRLREELRRDGVNRPVLARRTLAMIFEKPSLRTRVSFETGMTQLGGHAINLQPAEVGLNTREPAKDVARVLSGMADAIMARVFDHATLDDLAAASAVPVVNGLSDLAHPCQAMADLLTIRDEFGEDVAGRRVVYVGDANNVLRSLAAVCGRFGLPVVACCPDGYALADADLSRLKEQVPTLDYTATSDPRGAVSAADVVYTDTWTSMGQEAEKAARMRAFAGYQLDAALLNHAPPHAIVLHCLPAYRGLEISDDVIEGGRSRVWAQAHNRLHAQKGVLATLLAG